MDNRLPKQEISLTVFYPRPALVPSASPEDGVAPGEVASGEDDDKLVDPIFMGIAARSIIPAILSKREETGLQAKKSSTTCMAVSIVTENAILSANAAMSLSRGECLFP